MSVGSYVGSYCVGSVQANLQFACREYKYLQSEKHCLALKMLILTLAELQIQQNGGYNPTRQEPAFCQDFSMVLISWKWFDGKLRSSICKISPLNLPFFSP